MKTYGVSVLAAALAAGSLVTGCVHRVYEPGYTTGPAYMADPGYAPAAYVAPVAGPSYISTTIIDDVPPPPPPPMIPGPGPAYYGRPHRGHDNHRRHHHRPPHGAGRPAVVRKPVNVRPQRPAGTVSRPPAANRPAPRSVGVGAHGRGAGARPAVRPAQPPRGNAPRVPGARPPRRAGH